MSKSRLSGVAQVLGSVFSSRRRVAIAVGALAVVIGVLVWIRARARSSRRG